MVRCSGRRGRGGRVSAREVSAQGDVFPAEGGVCPCVHAGIHTLRGQNDRRL